MGSLWLACIFGLDKSVNDIFRLCVYCVVITTVVQNGQTQTKKKTHTKKENTNKKKKTQILTNGKTRRFDRASVIIK